MKSGHGVKTNARKSRRRRRRKASNANKMKSVDVENHIGVKKTSIVGKKRQIRKASVGVKEKVEVKMSVDEVEKLIISQLESWDDHRHHNVRCYNRELEFRLEMTAAAMHNIETATEPWNNERLDREVREECKKRLMELDKLLTDSDDDDDF